MNILIVTAMFPPIKTGTSFYSRNLANTLTQQGHAVTLVATNNPDYCNENFTFNVYRIKALHIKSKKFFKHLRITSLYYSNYKSIKRIAIETESDAIILINHYLDIAFPTIYASKKANIPLYISVGTQMQSLNPLRNKMLRILDKLICGNLIFPYCKNIISWDSEIDRYIKEVQNQKTANKSVIIPFGPNGDIEDLINFSKDYNQTNQIIGVGAIISQRDYLFNIKVFAKILEKFPNYKLKIIGHIYSDAPVKLAYSLGISDKIEFCNEMEHADVIKEMKNSDIHWMMLSGQYVGLGTATLEAMTLGIPVVSNVPSNLFDKNELIDMVNYVYTDGYNIEETTNKIISLIKNESEREKIGINGRNFIKKTLNWDNVGKEITNLLTKHRH